MQLPCPKQTLNLPKLISSSSKTIMMVGNIPSRWKELSGSTNWKSLLEPLDDDLRRCIIHYGQMAQASYDAFNSEEASKYAGSCRYDKIDILSCTGIAKNNPFEYQVVKYIYATSQVSVPTAFILKSLSREAWAKETNWMGFIAVATDKGKAALGRRDILVSWRGTIQAYEWIKDFDFPLVSSGKMFGDAGEAEVHKGFLSIYTSENPKSPFVQTSARVQVIDEVRRLVNAYPNEEMSITITGHSLGASLGTLNALDIVANNIHKPQDDDNNNNNNKKPCPVTAILFACPHVGNLSLHNLVQRLNKQLHILRVCNIRDMIPLLPVAGGYMDVGMSLQVDSLQSNYLKSPGDAKMWHNLEIYLHLVAGTHGYGKEFKLDTVKRDYTLVNKSTNALKREYLVPVKWWCERHKGMVQQSDGSWKLDDKQHLDSD